MTNLVLDYKDFDPVKVVHCPGDHLITTGNSWLRKYKVRRKIHRAARPMNGSWIITIDQPNAIWVQVRRTAPWET